MLEWMIENKEWLFSGVLVAVPLAIFGFIFTKRSIVQRQASGENSINTNAAGNAKVTSANISVENINNTQGDMVVHNYTNPTDNNAYQKKTVDSSTLSHEARWALATMQQFTGITKLSRYDQGDCWLFADVSYGGEGPYFDFIEEAVEQLESKELVEINGDNFVLSRPGRKAARVILNGIPGGLKRSHMKALRQFSQRKIIGIMPPPVYIPGFSTGNIAHGFLRIERTDELIFLIDNKLISEEHCDSVSKLYHISKLGAKVVELFSLPPDLP